MPEPPVRTSRRLRPWAGRVLALAGAWIVISGGEATGWPLGAAAVLAGATLDWPGHTATARWWRVDLFLRFAFFYAVHAVLGGVDVALRALDPRRSVDPGFVTVPLRLPPGPARSLLVVTISMLPGTVAADTVGGRLVVQRIHSGIDVPRGCRRAEERIAPLFGLELDAGSGREGLRG